MFFERKNAAKRNVATRQLARDVGLFYVCERSNALIAAFRT